jgi:hypothetical protein
MAKSDSMFKAEIWTIKRKHMKRTEFYMEFSRIIMSAQEHLTHIIE